MKRKKDKRVFSSTSTAKGSEAATALLPSES